LVWNCEWRLGLQREEDRGEKDSVAVLNDRELDGGRRATNVGVHTHTYLHRGMFVELDPIQQLLFNHHIKE